jgi:subtilase family serine protease
MSTAPVAPPWFSTSSGLVLDVPNLAPGAVFPSTVPFWASLVFSPGTYQFTATADFTFLVAESNEGNNTTMSSLTK